MASAHLKTYLNDHLAGSIAALELLQHLADAHAGTAREPVLRELHADITSDRQELRKLMERLEISESTTRQASAWVAEKTTQLKLLIDDPSGGALRLLESLEVAAIGIEGKQALWHSLRAISSGVPGLEGLDFDRLDERSAHQRDRVETLRLEAAKAALIEANED